MVEILFLDPSLQFDSNYFMNEKKFERGYFCQRKTISQTGINVQDLKREKENL